MPVSKNCAVQHLRFFNTMESQGQVPPILQKFIPSSSRVDEVSILLFPRRDASKFIHIMSERNGTKHIDLVDYQFPRSAQVANWVYSVKQIQRRNSTLRQSNFAILWGIRKGIDRRNGMQVFGSGGCPALEEHSGYAKTGRAWWPTFLWDNLLGRCSPNYGTTEGEMVWKTPGRRWDLQQSIKNFRK